MRRAAAFVAAYLAIFSASGFAAAAEPWTFDIDGVEVTWEFFKRYRLP